MVHKGANPPDVSVVSAIETFLAQRELPGDVFAPDILARLDRQEAFPEDACAALNEFCLAKWYVPICVGGFLKDHSDLLRVWRALARRDLTVAIAHGKTFLGGICVWIAGSDDQAARLRQEIFGGAAVSLGLTERAHGSDLLATSFNAVCRENKWHLNGEKWLINNATRAAFMCVFARTKPSGGPRGFSLFLIDKRELSPSTYCCLPKESTHGIRGADISGLMLNDAKVKSSNLIGKVGAGAEICLKALQITRTACAGLSLGAGDHALMIVKKFCHEHRIYGRLLSDLPMVRRVLGKAATRLILAEIASFIAGRSINTLTSEMSIVSAIIKAFVPTLMDETITMLGEQLGARSFLSDEYDHGSFQKLERDHRIVAIFDGSTIVNRNGLVNQFPLLVRSFHSGKYDSTGLRAASIESATPPDFAPERLTLISKNGCSLVQSLPSLTDEITRLGSEGRVPLTVVYLCVELLALTKTVLAEMSNIKPKSRDVSTSSFATAAKYEWCFAGAACLNFWFFNRESGNRGGIAALWENSLWLEAALFEIVNRLRSFHKREGSDVYDRLNDALTALPLGQHLTLFSTSKEGAPP